MLLIPESKTWSDRKVVLKIACDRKCGEEEKEIVGRQVKETSTGRAAGFRVGRPTGTLQRENGNC